MLVIGTAGHIDHGKSSIVKRLTGTDPDRLPEEQARGMTIDLGFAFRLTSDGSELAFVDVPGHERFVRNMIAGAGGIDVVMLVIAADDGWMPQTQEHLQIIRLLGIRHGFVVLNKIDLATPDWLALQVADIMSRTAGTTLAGSPIFQVSAASGEQFEPLEQYLDALPQVIHQQRDIGKARLPIDRAFVQTGIGAVGTGTLRGGAFAAGKPITLWPDMEETKIKTLQSRGRDIAICKPGTRTAVSLAGIGKEKLVRGSVVAALPQLANLRERPVLAIEIELLPEAIIALEDRRRVTLLLGTSETEAEVRIFDQDQIKPGGSGIVFVRPDHPLLALVGDRLIVRLTTPMATLGGGLILDQLESFPRRKEYAHASYLHERVSGGLPSLVRSELRKQLIASEERLLQHSIYPTEEIGKAIDALITDGDVDRFEQQLFLTVELDRIGVELKQGISSFSAANPHLQGMSLQLAAALLRIPITVCERVVSVLVSKGVLQRSRDGIALPEVRAELKGAIKQAFDQIISELRSSPTEPPLLPVLAARGKLHQQAIKYMIDHRLVHKCGGDLLLLTETWEQITAWMTAHLERTPQLTVQAIRDQFGFSRKYVIPILEETDRLGITARQGDVRVKGGMFGKTTAAS